MKKLALMIAVVAACGSKHPATQPPAPAPDAAVAASSGPDASVDSPGELAMADVQTAMEPVRDAIKDKCASTTAFAGVIKVDITIEPDGTTRATVEGSSGMPEVDKCVLDIVTAATFPTSQRGQRFHYSFRFK